MVGFVDVATEPAAGNEATLGAIACTLAGIKDWTFLLGPRLRGRVGDAFAARLPDYRSELVPRRWPCSVPVAGPLISSRRPQSCSASPRRAAQ